MAKFNRPKSGVKSLQATYDAIVRLTDEFCEQNLNAEYRELARNMAAALCRKRPSPLASGQPQTWACGIIHALGQVNFLSDRSMRPHMMQPYLTLPCHLLPGRAFLPRDSSRRRGAMDGS